MSGIKSFSFYPNVCHICKVYGKNVILILCPICQMISYCNVLHQEQHWPEHREICEAITKVIKKKIHKQSTNLTSEEWFWKKMDFMKAVTAKLNRRLQTHEEEMFKFPRACLVCHRMDNLVYCTHCPCVNICKEHQRAGAIEHNKNCNLLKLCFELDISAVDHRYLELHYLQFLSDKTNLQDMNQFVNFYICPQKQSGWSADSWLLIHSNYVTRPLTLLFAMKKLKLYPTSRESLVVHVIATTLKDMVNMQPWEILLHLMPSLISITIVMIGPYIKNRNYEHEICDSCMSQKKKLSFDCYTLSYEAYMCNEDFKQPDLIIGFNIGVHKYQGDNMSLFCLKEKWIPPAEVLSQQNCPYIVSSHTMDEIEKEKTRLNIALKKQIQYDYCGKNPFASLRPYRDFQSETVCYQNDYLIIFKNLVNP